MLIKRRSIKRRVSKHAFETKFKALGFTVVGKDEVVDNNNLDQMSHDELYSLAQDYDIYRRTKMDDKELIEAIKAEITTSGKEQ